MNDRELLELAAKAAGYRIEWCAEFPGGGCYMKTVVPEPPAPFSQRVPWNPLTDDGDALRLAVKLKFNFAYKPQDTDNRRPIPSGVTVWLRHPSSYGLSHTTKLPAFVFEQHHDEDHCAATRRAIVRAAAAIGEQMK